MIVKHKAFVSEIRAFPRATNVVHCPGWFIMDIVAPGRLMMMMMMLLMMIMMMMMIMMIMMMITDSTTSLLIYSDIFILYL